MKTEQYFKNLRSEVDKVYEMAEKGRFKTGTDTLIKIKLAIAGEVLTSLTQLVVVFYYVRVDGTEKKFSYFAKDPAAADIAAEAVTEGITVHQLIINGSILDCDIPQVDTDTLDLEECEVTQVFAEIAYLDSSSDKQKGIIVNADGQNCDVPIGEMVKSTTEGWL